MPESTEGGDNELEKENQSSLSKSKILSLLTSSDAKEPRREKTIKPPTKVVVRRLPPRYVKASFLNDFNLPSYDYICFVRGDLSLGPHAYSRAYVTFTHQEDVFKFKEKYDDFTLQDDQGREYHAVVEFSPSQRIPRGIKKKSFKSGTLDEDAKYVEFLNRLQQEKNNPGGTSSYFHETDSSYPLTKEDKEITITPLLEYMKLRQRKIEMKNEYKQKKRIYDKEKRKRDEETRKHVEMKKNDHDVENDNDVKPEDERKGYKKWESKRPFSKENKKDLSEKKKEDMEKYPNDKKEKYFKNDYDRGPKPFRKQETRIVTPSYSTKPTVNRNANNPEQKSKFRYSEQRNRNPQLKKQQTSEEVTVTVEPAKPDKRSTLSAPSVERCKSLETSEEKSEDPMNKRSFSLEEADDDIKDKKDPRTSRRIPNKERPAMEIYRPGMGKFSKNRMDSKSDRSPKEDSQEKEIELESN